MIPSEFTIRNCAKKNFCSPTVVGGAKSYVHPEPVNLTLSEKKDQDFEMRLSWII